jgi:hypothetical protein
MTATEINSFFQTYADAFSRSDVDGICALWDYPGFMSYQGSQAALDRDAFRRNTISLCAFYAARGLARAEKQVLEIDLMTETTATVRTADTLLDAAGAVITRWEHVYVLSATPGGLRAVAAFPDNELKAWRDLGAPMGGDQTRQSTQRR